MDGILYLEDGNFFCGQIKGKINDCEGEIVFTTAMTGYQETLSDPSYCNQIVTFTYPLLGNYGINKEDMESIRPHLKGVVAKEICDNPSNYRTEVSLDQYLKNCNIVCLYGIDTRKLTKILREKGTMQAKIKCSNKIEDNLTFNNKSENKKSWVSQVTTPKPYFIPGSKYKLVVLDLGCKKSLIDFFSNEGAGLVVLPADSPAEEILSYNPDGIVFSNGPGDPKSILEVTYTINKLVEKEIPIFGVCLGHQMIGLSFGLDSFKMKFGHRGINHPVKNLLNKKVSITSQNHGYALKNKNLPTDIEITHLNVNDNTIEGIRHKSLPIFSIQFHPEANPGPKDNEDLIHDFLFMIEKDKKTKTNQG